MSYILDALKRAERERGSTMADPTGTARGPAPGRLRPLTVALIGATLFLAGVGVAALLLQPARPPPPGAQPRPEDRAPPEAAAPAPTPSAGAAPLLPEASGLAAYESLDDVSPVFQGSPTVAVPAAPSTGTAAPAASPAAGAGSAEPARDDATRSLPPRLAEMPEDFQSRFGAPLIQVHVFDAEPARRWIMVDNRRHGEGGVLGNGLRIAEIVSDGVIFEFEGRRVYWPLKR